MYRVKSNAIWHSLPGVEAVYQPIGAPDSFAARFNVGAWHRMVGKYTATPGVLPTWSPEKGWTCSGTSLKTGIIATSAAWTYLASFANAPSASEGTIIGAWTESGGRKMIWLQPYPNSSGRQYRNGGGTSTAALPGMNAGVIGMAATTGYINGIADVTVATGYPPGLEFWIGSVNKDGTSDRWFSGIIKSLLLASRTLTPAEMWLASRQMAYCEVNPDWNAWARRRQYFFAPSAAAIRWPGVGRGGPIGGSPGIRGSQ